MVWSPRRLARRTASVSVATVVLLGVVLVPTARGASLVTIDRAHDDSVTLTAAVGTLPAIADGTDVVVSIGSLALSAPADALEHRGKHVLTYDGGKDVVGLSRLRVDLRRGRVTLRAQHLVLPSIAGPMVFRVGTDDATACAILRAVPVRGRRKSGVVRFRLVRDGGVCVLVDPPRASPPTVVIGAPVAVHFTATLPAGVDAGSATVRRLGANGKPSGAPLCAIAANADGCDATLTESAAGRIGVVVEATASRKPVRSPATALLAAPLVTDADGATLAAVQQQVPSIWSDALGRLGDSLDARMAALAAIRRLDGVDDAQLSPDGDDLVYRFASGIIGSLVLSVRFDGMVGTAVTRPALLGRPPGVAVSTPGPAAGGDPCAPMRQLTGNLGAVIFDPGYFAASEGSGIAARMNASCVDFGVTPLIDDDATIAGLTAASGASTLVLITHGSVDMFGRVAFLTADVVDTYFPTHKAEFQNGQLLSAELVKGLDVVGVSPDYPGLPSLANGIVYAGFCNSLRNDSLAAAFRTKGANAYFGYDREVSTAFAMQAGTQLFDGLVTRFQTTGDADAGVSPKVDPYANRRPAATVGVQPAVVSVQKHPAHFLKSGDDDLAYVGVADLTPASPFVNPGTDHDTATLTVTVERGENCPFKYHWHDGAIYGHLSNADGQDDFDSQLNSAQYQANADAPQGIESVQVDVHPPEDADAGDTLVATACGGVNVSQQPHTLHIVFDGQGTWSQTIPQTPPTPDFHASAMVMWHAVYEVSLPDLQPNSTQNAGAGTTVTGSSSISGPSNCSGGLVVNTSHGQGPPPPDAQTPFLLPLPSPFPTARYAIDAMGGYDYRLCDGEYNIGEGNWAPGDPFLPSYAGAPFFGVFTFDRNDFVNAPHMQAIPLSVNATATSGIADVSWDGTVTLTSE